MDEQTKNIPQTEQPEEEVSYGFVKMRPSQIISIVLVGIIVIVSCTPPLTGRLILGLSASQWVLGIVSLAFPVIHIVRMNIARSKGDEGL